MIANQQHATRARNIVGADHIHAIEHFGQYAAKKRDKIPPHGLQNRAPWSAAREVMEH